MITPELLESMTDRLSAAHKTIPGVVGGIAFIRDPDGPGDANPAAAIIALNGEHAHATGHLLQSVNNSFRIRPAGMEAPIEGILGEIMDRWAATNAGAIEDIIQKHATMKRPPLPPEVTTDPTLVAIANEMARVVDEGLPAALREVIAHMIKKAREAWAHEAAQAATVIATLAWDAATSNACSADRDDEAGA